MFSGQKRKYPSTALREDWEICFKKIESTKVGTPSLGRLGRGAQGGEN